MYIIILFGTSLVGIIALLMFKRWKRVIESVPYRSKREYGDKFVVRVSDYLHAIPHASNVFVSRLFHAFAFYVSAWMLRAVRFLERRLFKFVNMIKGRREINHKKGSASLFLTAISDKNKDLHYPE